MKYRFALVILTLVLFCAGLVNAAPAVPAPDDLADPYDIELVVFSRPNDNSGERWPQEAGEPDLTRAFAKLKPSPQGPLFELKDGEPELDGAVYTLRRRGMQILLHERWRQDIQDRDAPSWLLMDTPTARGLIRISKGRYLHLDTDLLLEQANTTQTWRIQLHRRMRSGELHYVDHPKLGLLIIAKRVERLDPTLPEETPAETPPAETPDPKPAPPAPGNGLPRSLPDPT